MEGSTSGGNEKTIPKNMVYGNKVAHEIIVNILEDGMEQEIQNVLMTREHSLPRCSDIATIDMPGQNVTDDLDDKMEAGMVQVVQNEFMTRECSILKCLDRAIMDMPERNVTSKSEDILNIGVEQELQNILMTTEHSLPSNLDRAAANKCDQSVAIKSEHILEVEKEVQNVLLTTDHILPRCSDRASLDMSEQNVAVKPEDILNIGVEQVKNVLMTTEHSLPSCSDGSSVNKFESNITNGSVLAMRGNLTEDPIEECVQHHRFNCSTHISREYNSTSLPIPNIVFSSCSLSSPDLFEGLEQNVSRSQSHSEPPAYTLEEPSAPIPGVATITLQRLDPLRGPPPSYSKCLLDRRINPCASIQFVAPIPPPSYDGLDNELRYGGYSRFTLGLGNTWQSQPQPAYCPACETVVITRVEIKVSRFAHTIALIMLLMLCWPFCVVPYFINYFNYTFHYCTLCQSYLGARRPFQRS